MQLVLLILLIPVCSISFFVYLNALMNYAFYNVLNIPLLSGGVAGALILGFIAFSMFNNARTFCASKLNFENKVIPYFSYYSFVLLLLFGVTLLIHSLKYNMDYYMVAGGLLIIGLFFYVTFFYIFASRTDTFVLSSLEEIDEREIELPNAQEETKETNEDSSTEDKEELPELKKVDNNSINDQEELPKVKKENAYSVKCLTFKNDDIDFIEYYIDEGNYIQGKKYKIKYNPKLKIVNKILDEEIEEEMVKAKTIEESNKEVLDDTPNKENEVE